MSTDTTQAELSVAVALMTCENCRTAAAGPHHGFTQGCIGCCARTVARSPQFDRVRRSGLQDRAYRSLLAQFAVTHEQAKEAFRLDALHKTTTTEGTT
jgi:hypothetical protein